MFLKVDAIDAYECLPELIKVRVNESFKQDDLTLDTVHLNYLVQEIKEIREYEKVKVSEIDIELNQQANYIIRSCNEWLRKYDK